MVINNKTTFFLGTIFLFAIISSVLYYTKIKQENLALKLKIASLTKSYKLKARTWNELKNSPKQRKKIKRLIPKKENNLPSKLFDPTTLSLQELITHIDSFYSKNNYTKSIKDLNNTLSAVNELIDREPSSYSAYKAKLILLLIKESGFSEPIDELEVEQTLNSMASFDLLSNLTLRKEAFLISRANQQLDELGNQIIILEDQLEELDESSPDTAILSLKRETMYSDYLEIENNIQTGLLSDQDFINEDLVEIPFYRDLANNDIQKVIDNANELLDEYPQSITGYLFLIKGLELDNNTELADEIISNSSLTENQMLELKKRLSKLSNFDPKKYWKKLRF
ncbi:MAG: hypothetical protein HON90_03785 [Halobacteriovoraceae bacterium]|jgi:hypothetical protein|nr:hypothetical protein [Halobacteriovoraceae bacterium]